MLFDTGSEAFEVSVPVVIVIAVLLGGSLVFVVAKAVEARGRPVASGREEMIGARGDVRQPLDPVGQVFVRGALWRAAASRTPIRATRIGCGRSALSCGSSLSRG